MPTAELAILGKTFRLACGEGQEARLYALAAQINQQLQALGLSFVRPGSQSAPHVSESMLMVMLLLKQADELQEAQAQIDLWQQRAEGRAESTAGDLPPSDPRMEQLLAQTVHHVAERLEKLAAVL